MQGRFKELYKDNSGASLLFVLGIMLFLLAIGTSLLVAASTNVGYMTNQREHSQVRILDESIHMTIMFSLQDSVNVNSLGRQLARALYEAQDLFDSGGGGAGNLNDITITPDEIEFLDNAGNEINFANTNVRINNITFSFPVQAVNITEAVNWQELVWDDDPDWAGWPGWDDTFPDESFFNWFNWGDWENDDNFPDLPDGVTIWRREPATASINAALHVIVEIAAINRVSGNERMITSRAVYEYSDGFLLEDLNSIPLTHVNSIGDIGGLFFASSPNAAKYTMNFADIGRWELLSYENIAN
ncbi:MAG: hypothetical protein FWE14_12200 [Lachnospiraceae bacterium]|nr:hypothetical protein [Lachnospiraceae bacterium]